MQLYDFQTYAGFVNQYDLYYDRIHYISSVNDAMAQAMAAGTCLITDAQQIGVQIRALREAVYELFETPSP